MNEHGRTDVDTVKDHGHKKDVISNRNPKSTPFGEILEERLSRRQALMGGLGLAATTLFAGAGLAACGSGSGDNNTGDASDDGGDPAPTTGLNFDSIPGQDTISTTVADDHRQQVIVPWGTGFLGSYPSFDQSGATSHSGMDQAEMIGTNHE